MSSPTVLFQKLSNPTPTLESYNLPVFHSCWVRNRIYFLFFFYVYVSLIHYFPSSFQITMKQNLHIRGTTLITISRPLFLSSCKKKAILCCEVSQTREMLRPHLDFFFSSLITHHSSLNFRHLSLIIHHSLFITQNTPISIPHPFGKYFQNFITQFFVLSMGPTLLKTTKHKTNYMFNSKK